MNNRRLNGICLPFKILLDVSTANRLHRSFKLMVCNSKDLQHFYHWPKHHASCHQSWLEGSAGNGLQRGPHRPCHTSIKEHTHQHIYCALRRGQTKFDSSDPLHRGCCRSRAVQRSTLIGLMTVLPKYREQK